MANWAADQPNETMDTDFPAGQVTWNVWTHELVPAEKLQEGTKMQAEQPPVDRVWTMYTPLWKDNRATFPIHLATETSETRRKNLQKIPPRSCHQHNPGT